MDSHYKVSDMTEKQKERIQYIKERWLRFGYGLGQADHDIRFLLRMITGKDPDADDKRK